MVAVVQLVEHLVVVQDVAGSSPVSHPDKDPTKRSDLFYWLCGELHWFAFSSPPRAGYTFWQMAMIRPGNRVSPMSLRKNGSA